MPKDGVELMNLYNTQPTLTTDISDKHVRVVPIVANVLDRFKLT